MTSSGYRLEARKVLKGKWVNVVLIVVVYKMLCELATKISSGIISSKMLFSNKEVLSGFTGKISDLKNLSNMMEELSDQLNSVNFLTGIIDSLIQSLLVVGFYTLLLNLFKRNRIDIGEIFSGAKYWAKAFGIIVLTTIYTALWMLLFIVPGIIKAYSYSMALYIYAQNPEKGVNECIAESQEMMRGHKWSLFCLHFSFIGWSILMVIAIIIPLVNIFAIVAGPYIIATYVETSVMAFYLDVSGQLRAITQNTEENLY